MYVSELTWYQREKKRKILLKRWMSWGRKIIICLMVIAVLVCIPWGDFFVKNRKEVTLNLIDQKEETAPQNIEEKADENKNIDTNKDKEIDNCVELLAEKDVPVIILDPGHGGMDEGCSREGIEEKEINLKLAFSLKNKLEEKGFCVLLTRENDEGISLTERADFARKMNGDLLISIHQNACEYDDVEGIEIWYDESVNSESERLARLLQKYLISGTEAKDRGISNTDTLYVIRECGMPACLVETGFLSNPEERELLLNEDYCEKIVQGLADAVWYFFYPKKMYLTFDDGPSRENTEIILDILKERNVRATFFVVGENVKKYPDIIKRMVQEGHVIGIHCYNHSYEKIYAGVQEYIDDFEQAKKLVYEITGEDVWCYRFPGGSINKYNKHIYSDIIEKMSEQGYVYYDWNGCFEDAVSNPSREQIVKNAVESTLKRKKVIMLAHDTVDETAECLNEVLDLLPEYEFLPLSKEVLPIQFK